MVNLNSLDNFGPLKCTLFWSSCGDLPGRWPLGLMTLATQLRNDYAICSNIRDLPLSRAELVVCLEGLPTSDLGSHLFVGFSTMCDSLPRSLSIAKAIKRQFPHLPVVFGGPQAAACADRLIDTYGFIDVVVVGEAEAVLDKLILYCRTKVGVSEPGLLFRASSSLHVLGERRSMHAPLVDIDAIPPIDYSTYGGTQGDDSLPIEVGRGCPYGCTFCATNDFFRRTFRLRSPGVIASDIRRLRISRRIKKFEFIHDMFTTNRKLVVKVCEELCRTEPDVKWGCSARADRVDPELLQLMYQAGCRELYFGIETGSQRLQKAVSKNLDLELARRRIDESICAGMTVTTSLIMGFPQEQIDDLVDTVSLLLRLRTYGTGLKLAQIHLLSPLTNTPIMRQFADRMMYDGFKSDIAAIDDLTEWEHSEVRSHSDLFSAYYYLENESIHRNCYKYLFWILLHGVRMDEFFHGFVRILGDRAGRALVEWCIQQGDALPKHIDYWKLSESAPLLAIHLRRLIGSTVTSDRARDYLTNSLEYDAWKCTEGIKQNGDVLVLSTKHGEDARNSGWSASDAQEYLYYVYRLADNGAEVIRMCIRGRLGSIVTSEGPSRCQRGEPSSSGLSNHPTEVVA